MNERHCHALTAVGGKYGGTCRCGCAKCVVCASRRAPRRAADGGPRQTVDGRAPRRTADGQTPRRAAGTVGGHPGGRYATGVAHVLTVREREDAEGAPPGSFT